MMYIIITDIILGIIGTYIAIYILRHKTTNTPMPCSIDHDCNIVVASSFGKTLGVENTHLGILYYIGITLSYIVIYYNNFVILTQPFSFWVMLGSIFGALFSWYLIWVMKFKLKEWCDWCLGSAVVIDLIMILAVIGLTMY